MLWPALKSQSKTGIKQAHPFAASSAAEKPLRLILSKAAAWPLKPSMACWAAHARILSQKRGNTRADPYSIRGGVLFEKPPRLLKKQALLYKLNS